MADNNEDLGSLKFDSEEGGDYGSASDFAEPWITPLLDFFGSSGSETARGMFRGFHSGLTAKDPAEGAYMPGGILPSLAHIAGVGAGFMGGPARLAATGLRSLSSAFPRIGKTAETYGRTASVAEDMFAAGFQEAALAGGADKDPIGGALYGSGITGLTTAPFRGIGALATGFSSPTDALLTKFLSKVTGGGIRKGGIPKERERMTEVLAEYGVALPGASRPSDWYLDMLETRASRSFIGRQWLQEAATNAQRALDDFARKVQIRLGPNATKGPIVDNAAMGGTLKSAFKESHEEVHDEGSRLYNQVFSGPTGNTKVNVEYLIGDLKNLLEHWNYDPTAALQVPAAGRIQSFIRSLEKGAKDVEIELPDGTKDTVKEYLPQKLNWIQARLRTLNPKNQRIRTAEEQMQLDAAGTIRSFIHDMLEALPDDEIKKAAKLARIKWKEYHDLRRHPLAKLLEEGDSTDVVDQLFRTKDTIENAREVLTPANFELARQRWIANMVFKAGRELEEEATARIARPGTGPGASKGAKGAEYVIDADSLNRTIRNLGGVDGETLRVAFADAPEKLKALTELQLILSQAKPTIQRYGGTAEGISESGRLATFWEKLFTTITYPVNLAMTGRAAKKLVAPPGSNIFLGGIPSGSGPSMFDRTLIEGMNLPRRHLAGAVVREPMR